MLDRLLLRIAYGLGIFSCLKWKLH